MNTAKSQKYFNKNLIMIEEEEKRFQSNNTCWICEKLIDGEKLEIVVT